MVNMTERLGAIKDAHARKLGDFTLRAQIVQIGGAREVFEFVSNLGGRFFRVVYRCKDGRIRDMTGRQGVYASAQDGEVQGTGRPMRNAERMTLSFWTDARGGKVNTGAGAGYRTLRAEGILAMRIEGTDIVTDAGVNALRG